MSSQKVRHSPANPSHARRSDEVLIVNTVGDHAHVVALRPGPWDHLLVRLSGHRLDAQLAAGRPPDEGRLLALRAALLVDPETRAALAQTWESVLDRAGQPPRPLDPRAQLAREPILAARHDIRRLIGALRARRPVPARGVAMAQLLLTDGSGPLYSSRRHVSLASALSGATRQLDASEPLLHTDQHRRTPLPQHPQTISAPDPRRNP